MHPVPDELPALTEALEARPWLEVVYDRYFHADPYVFRLIADETRADFRFVLPLPVRARVLEVGPDWGLVTAAFAREHAVTAIDPSAERLAFIRRRLAQDQLSAELVVGSPLALPFENGVFDAVIFNGSLEWVGALGSADPREQQVRALAEAGRVLAPGGCVYVGTENRRAFRALLGEPDDHTRVADIAYLSREDATALLGSEYRTLTHTFEGHEALFAAAGLGPPALYLPYPDDRTPEALLSTVSEPALAYYLSAVRDARPAQEMPERVRRLELEALEEGRMTGFAAAYALVSRKASV